MQAHEKGDDVSRLGDVVRSYQSVKITNTNSDSRQPLVITYWLLFT